MRHAPLRFVQQGNADWYDNHGFEGANVQPESPYRLQVRVNRERPIFDFMEPVVVELKLTNISPEPVLIPTIVLALEDKLVAIIKREGKSARQHVPYARNCVRERNTVLPPGESIYESLFLSAGLNGWQLAEPGYYTVQVALHLNGEDVVSNALRLRITPPRGYEEEALAQDFFSDDVGRILAFDGSRILTAGNDAMRELAERFPDNRATVHARIALGNAVAVERKRLELGEGMRLAGPATWQEGES